MLCVNDYVFGDFIRTDLGDVDMARPLPSLDPAATALVLIDLQRGIVGMQTHPRPAADVVRNAVRLIAAARTRGALVVLVHVSFAADGADALRLDTDEASPAGQRPANWDAFVDEVQPDTRDIVITKHQWGAFYGTDLDLQLRRRGRRTIILGGISTNIGVESTARDAYERGYQLILVEDAMASMRAEDHVASVTRIFPRLGRVCTTDAVLAVWGAS
jgi:nicotinamidase-related amidase